MPKKKEDTEIIENPIAEEESDFADELKEEPIEEIIEEAPLEETKEEPAPAEEAKAEAEPKVEEPKSYEYDDPNLEAIEFARAACLKSYRGMGKWTILPTVVMVAGIVLAWILPNYVWPDNSTLALGITIGIVAVILVLMIVLSVIKKRKTDARMKVYLNDFYTFTGQYVFDGTGITNLTGDIDSKLTKIEFEEAGLYKDLFNVGSRASLTFNYKGHKCGIADAAGQIKGAKALQTVFVGKFMRATNNYKGATLTIYLKGNDRALPPTDIDDIPVIIEDKTMVVRGEQGAKKAFTKKVKDAIKSFRMDETLVDMTVRIEEGKTFILFGYEDTLMILPMEKPFNPAPTQHYKADFRKALDLIDAIDGIKRSQKDESVAEEEPKAEELKAEETVEEAKEATPEAVEEPKAEETPAIDEEHKA